MTSNNIFYALEISPVLFIAYLFLTGLVAVLNNYFKPSDQYLGKKNREAIIELANIVKTINKRSQKEYKLTQETNKLLKEFIKND